LDRQLAKKEWIYFKEGKDATVLVEQEGEHRALSINGKVVATSNEGDTSNQYLLSLIPYLLHGGFEQSAVIGLGTGMTAGVAAELSKKLDIVDINVDVLGAATTFAKNNFDLMNRVGKPSPVDGKTAVQIFIEDGRHFMRATPKKYDLITSDPIDPFTQGSTNLYSLEYFQLCRQHLKPGGYFTHWLPLYQMGTKEFWEIIKTFSTVFPNGTIWLTHSDSILVASVDESGATAPTRIDWRLAKQRFEKKPSQQMFQAIHINNLEHALSLYMGDTERMSLAVAPIPVVTDDNLLMELSLPKYLYAETIFPNIDFLLEQKARNGSSFKSLLLDQSTYQDNKSSQIDFTFEPLLSKVIRFHGQPINSETIAEFKKLDAQVKQYPTLRRRLLASLRDKSETAYMLQGATLGWQLLKSYPTQDLEIILIEMNWLLVENRSDELLKKTRQAIAIDPQHYFVNFVMGKLAMRQRQFPQSIDYFEIALKNDPLREIQPEALNNLAACYYQMKNIPAAIEYLRSSLKIQPNQPEIESLLRVIR
jgi:spermidine synthase